MASLTSTQRSALEKAVIKARKLSLKGATHALEAFAVHHSEPYSHMSPEDRALRNELRSKARLLGDQTTSDGGHTINKLAYELAYEYWHQMLFARFLEANHLLMHPEHNIAVTLEECEELGKEEGYEDKWQAAAHYASRMLPAIFRQDDPLMQIKYATEDRIALEQVIEGIESEVFIASDSIGWVYQYWQTEEKARVNKTGDPITGQTISAVTQLFTEPYMVHFLIDNTLGAWWTARNLGMAPPIPFEYLRTLDNGSPAAGSFDGWPDQLSEVTVLEPCMGSGHFVVEIFLVMAHLRMHDEELTKEEACDAVIRDNIHGLELDPRCTQIAAFNLALAAWKFCGTYRQLPEMNLACCGMAPIGKKSDWTQLADIETDPTVKARLRGGLSVMYDLFQQAPVLGSLIDPTIIRKDAFTSDFEELSPFLDKALFSEIENDKTEFERGMLAAGIAKAGRLLSNKYVWQITNVPYLARGKQGKALYEFSEQRYPASKGDLATVFYEKMLRSLSDGGTASVVIPQDWLFKITYKNLRNTLLTQFGWNLVARLGPKSFQTVMYDFNVMLISISNIKSTSTHSFMGLDVSECPLASDKEKSIKKERIHNFNQDSQKYNPDHRIVFEDTSQKQLLAKYADGIAGIQTGDFPLFGRYFWELLINNNWEFELTTFKGNDYYLGRNYIIYWENFEGELYKRHKANQSYVRGWAAFGKKGVLISPMGNLKASIYNGEYFDNNSCVILAKDENELPAIWCFTQSDSFNEEVRKIDQALKVTNSTLIKIPFDHDHWQKVAKEKYPNGLPKPYSDDPTQWLFHGHPLNTEDSLQVTIARLLGYTWPAESDKNMELSDEAHHHIRAIHDLDLAFDEDGIVCIPSVEREVAAADRIRDNIKNIWGDDYSSDTITELIAATGSKKRDLVSYLRDDFFDHHVKLFKNRPFIWNIWDGRKDGFSALVNYHKFDKATLQKLIYTYLGDWINQCERKLANQVSGADGLLSTATKLKEQLVLILEGEPPYDTFIRWKPASEQSIGWDPDFNDGVRLNIQPFIQANILRKNLKAKIKVNKDRGKNPSGSHWGPERYNRYEEIEDQYKLRDEKGNIIPHLTNAVKRKLREE